MEQGVLAAFKDCYLRTFAQATDVTEEDTDAILEGLQHLWLRQEPCLGSGWCQQGVCEWHLEEDTQKQVHDFKGFAKDEEVAKTSKAVAEMANNLNVGVEGTLGSSQQGFWGAD